MKLLTHLFVVGLLGVLAADNALADQVSGCVKKKTGAVRIADQCKKKEKPIALAIAGPQGAVGPQGATGSQGAAGPQPRHAYTLVVGQAGIDGTGRALTAPDYTTITEALNSIPPDPNADSLGSCDPRSPRYLIKVLPGTYDEKVVMKPCVDIEGSGENNTTISAQGGAGEDAASATVVARAMLNCAF